MKLNKLPSELFGLTPTWEEVRVMGEMMRRKDEGESSTCPKCSERHDKVDRTCPICGLVWHGARHDARYSGSADEVKGADERRGKVFSIVQQQARERAERRWQRR